MGRHTYSNRKTVDEYKLITVIFLNKHHYFDDARRTGGCVWKRNGEEIGNIEFVISTLSNDAYIRFQYVKMDRNTGEKSEFDYKTTLVSTPCFFGGHRWWFTCPVVNAGKICNRRVGILYLGINTIFGCRHCYNLTYKSCKENDKRINALRKDQILLMSYADSPNLSKKFMALTALRKGPIHHPKK